VRNLINGAFLVLSAVSAHELTVGIISQLESVLHDLDQKILYSLMPIFEIFDNYQFGRNAAIQAAMNQAMRGAGTNTEEKLCLPTITV
jgi:hypothetical protein